MKAVPRVIMAGPLPPAVGGMVTVIADLAASSLAHKVELALFDTGKRTPVERSLVQAIVFRFRLWRAWWRITSGQVRPIVHIHTCSGMTFWLDAVLLLLARARGLPAVLHVHGGAFDKFIDGLRYPLSGIARWVARRASCVVVLSDEWHRRLEPRLPGAAFRVIENGVPIDACRRIRSEATDGGIVLFLGNLTTAKGVWDLLAAANALPAGWRLVMVGGEGEPGIMDRLRARISETAMGERVEIAGAAVGAAKRGWLERAAIFVLASHVEGLPVSMLEAMAASLPVIVTPVGAIPSVVRDGVEGLIVPVSDAQRLREALSRLASDPDLRRRFGAAGHQRILERYSVEQRVRDYEVLYAEVLTAQGGRSFCPRRA